MLRVRIENCETGQVLEKDFECMFAVIGKTVYDESYSSGTMIGQVINVIPKDKRLFEGCIAKLQQLLIDLGMLVDLNNELGGNEQ